MVVCDDGGLTISMRVDMRVEIAIWRDSCGCVISVRATHGRLMPRAGLHFGV